MLGMGEWHWLLVHLRAEGPPLPGGPGGSAVGGHAVVAAIHRRERGDA